MKNIYSWWWMMIHIFWRGLRNAFLIFFFQTLWNNAQYDKITIFRFILVSLYFTRCADIVRLLYTKSNATCGVCYGYWHVMCSEAYFSSCVYIMYIRSGHGAAVVLLPGFAVDVKAGWKDGRTSVTLPMCIRPRVCICARIYVFVDA